MRAGRGAAALALAASGAAWAVGCANQGAPPGGPIDRRPPVVVRTEPDTFAVVQDLGASIRFHFDERISESAGGGALADAVTVSPLTGAVRVSHGSRTLTVDLEGGLRPGLVYRVTLLPVVRDLFGNQLGDPFELVFSTGGTPTATTLAGEIWDRVTGQGMQGALVHARGADSLVHVAAADQQGIFAFRYLPAGSYVVTGFDDLDRDRAVDARETQGSVVVDVAEGDTLLVDVPVLPPDTTPAVVLRTSALDSVTLVVELDDWLDPEAATEGVRVTLVSEDAPAPAVTRVLHEHAYDAYVLQVLDSLARADSVAAAAAAAAAAAVAATPDSAPALPPDSAAALPPDSAVGSQADSAAAARDPALGPGGAVPGDPQVADSGGGAASDSARGPQALTRRGPPSLGGGGGQRRTGPGGRALPSRRLVALLDAPLTAGATYTVTVSGATNLNGLVGENGDGTLRIEAPAAAPAEPAAPGAAGDAAGGPPTPGNDQ